MRTYIVRALLAFMALGFFALPAEAQRRARQGERDSREVRLDLRFRDGRPSVRLTAYDRWYYGPPDHHYVSLRRLARISPARFRLVMRDHRHLHRHMARAPRGHAERMHRQWHRQQGWRHYEFVELERW